MRQSAEKELEAFFTPLPACVRKELLYEPMSPQELLESLNGPYKAWELRPQLERILWQMPAEWNKYCQRHKQHAETLSPTAKMMDLLPPVGRAGAPRKDREAEKYAAALDSGKSLVEIAKEELKDELNDPKLSSDKKRNKVKQKADSIRKLVDSRRPNSE